MLLALSFRSFCYRVLFTTLAQTFFLQLRVTTLSPTFVQTFCSKLLFTTLILSFSQPPSHPTRKVLSGLLITNVYKYYQATTNAGKSYLSHSFIHLLTLNNQNNDFSSMHYNIWCTICQILKI